MFLKFWLFNDYSNYVCNKTCSSLNLYLEVQYSQWKNFVKVEFKHSLVSKCCKIKRYCTISKIELFNVLFATWNLDKVKLTKLLFSKQNEERVGNIWNEWIIGRDIDKFD